MDNLLEKRYYSQVLFMLNVLELMNENASTFSAYMIDSIFGMVG